MPVVKKYPSIADHIVDRYITAHITFAIHQRISIYRYQHLALYFTKTEKRKLVLEQG